MRLIRKHLILLATLFILALSACGGDSGSSDPDPDLPDVCTDDEMGTTGCACTVDDACLEASDGCSAGICSPRTSCESEIGCGCDLEGACADGLTCEEGLCRVENGLVVTVAGNDIRACDIRVETDGRQVDDVIFPAGVRGRMRTRNEATAMALIRTSDTAMIGAVATIVFSGTDAAAADIISSVTATCYDRSGNPVDGPDVNVD